MNAQLSFLPKIQNVKKCEFCNLSERCENVIPEDFYCRKRRFEEIVIDGFEWNKHGVCTNPREFIVTTNNKKYHGIVSIAMYKDNRWRFGYSYNYPNGGAGGHPSVCGENSYETMIEAKENGAKYVGEALTREMNVKKNASDEIEQEEFDEE